VSAGEHSLPWLAVACAWLVLAGEAGAQAPTVDTSVPVLPGGVGSSLGGSPGAGNSAMGTPPGAGGSAPGTNLPGGGVLGGRPGPYAPKGVPTSVTTPGGGQGPTALQLPITAPQPQPVGPTTSPFYGTMDLPTTDDDGPADGLTLEQAVDVALARNLDLRQKYIEIPMARADILQASLRANPVFYQDGQLLQYQRGEFNRSRPGGPQQFDTNVTYPVDISQKRRARTTVATRAQKVLEAQYQDAVRNRIDDVYGAFVTALNARQTMRYARTSVSGLAGLQDQTQKLFKAGGATQLELDRVENQVRVARLGLVDAEAGYRKAKLDLGSFLNLSIEEGTRLEIRGSIDVQPPPLPPVEELRRIALDERPDIVAYRLGVSRAYADVRLAKANAYSDIYVLWQPYTFQDNSPYGVKSATSWALGVTVPLPIYNRNQGGILRAKMNVDQSKMQLTDVERQAVIDIEEAIQEFEVSRRLIQELKDQIIPDAREILTDTYKLRRAGSLSVIEVISAQLDFNDKVQQYLATAIRYRRSMLAINTVVGKKIMP
jgi:cobalt-zinc-cadmium efflux system outer membrane protein